MSDERWIVVPKWDEFQHYKDREPLWIKLYTELASNDDWLELSDADRGVLTLIWIFYARARGQLRVSRVLAEVRQKNRRGAIERLNHAGFIAISASKPLALTRSREKEKSREEEGSSKSHRPKPGDESRRPHHEKACPDCGETYGAGHLETCPRMPQLADDLLEAAR